MSGSNPEAAAVQVLTRAVQLDNDKKFAEALTCYEQGIRLLLEAAKGVQDESKRTHFTKKTKEYLARAEAMKEAATKQKTLGKNHKQIHIEAGATGYSYDTIFGPLIDSTLTAVAVYDAYIRSTHQVDNFLRLCELLIRKGNCLKTITLVTSRDPNDERTQQERLQEIQQSASRQNVNVVIEYSSTIHDREIRFDSGWIIKIGRGLDYFRKADSRFSLGWNDFNFRKCQETTIDIFHQQVLQ